MPLKVCFRNDKLRSQSFKDTCDIKFSACEVIFRGGGGTGVGTGFEFERLDACMHHCTRWLER